MRIHINLQYTVRWCIDLRKLNDVTVKDCFPLLLLQDCIDALEGCQYFTTLDMASVYYQLDAAEEDRDKTAFITKYCIFLSFRRMPRIGVVNFHRDHMSLFTEVAKPLYDEMGPTTTFVWGEELQNAFDVLKTELTEAPVFAYPHQYDHLIMDTDASNHSISAELLQVQDGIERLIGFGSFVLNSVRRNYCTTRKELLAVVRFTRHFKHYLLGSAFTVRTDHSSPTWLMGFKNIEGKLARWIEELSMYNMQIVHRAGKKHVNADGLSRIQDLLTLCNCYSAGSRVEDLPCDGCKYCVRAHSNWERFYNDVDDIVHLAIGHVSHDATNKVPKDDLT